MQGSENEFVFFTLLEKNLQEVLNMLIQPFPQMVGSTDIRHLLKSVASNFDMVFMKKPMRIDYGSLTSINNVLNAHHHYGATPWERVENVVRLVITLLQDVETFFKIPTANITTQLNALWSQVPTASEFAFMRNNSLLQIVVSDVLPFPTKKDAVQEEDLEAQATLCLPPSLAATVDVTKFVEDFADRFEVHVTKHTSSPAPDGGLLVLVTLASAAEVGLVDNFKYLRQHQVTIRKNQKTLRIILKSVPSNKTEEDIKKQLKVRAITSSSVVVHPVMRDDNSIVIEGVSQEDIDALNEDPIVFAGNQPLSLNLAEKKNNTVVVYLSTPPKSVLYFCNIWDNHFEFSVEDRVVFAGDNESAIVSSLTDAEYTQVQNKSGSFALGGKKVTVATYSEHRLTLTLPTVLVGQDSPETIKAAVCKFIPAESLTFVHVVPGHPKRIAYIHVADAKAKTILLNAELTFAVDTPKASTPTPQASIPTSASPTLPTASQGSGASSSGKPPHQTSTKTPFTLLLSGIPNDIPARAIYEKLKTQFYIKFITLRNGNAYAELEGNTALVPKELFVDTGKAKATIPVEVYEGAIPYFSLWLEPGLSSHIFPNDILSALLKTRVGTMRVVEGKTVVPFGSETDWKMWEGKVITVKGVNMKFVVPSNSPQTTAGGKGSTTTPTAVPPTTVVKEIMHLDRSEYNFLMKKRKEKLAELKSEFDVKFIFFTPKPQNNNNNNNNSNSNSNNNNSNSGENNNNSNSNDKEYKNKNKTNNNNDKNNTANKDNNTNSNNKNNTSNKDNNNTKNDKYKNNKDRKYDKNNKNSASSEKPFRKPHELTIIGEKENVQEALTAVQEILSPLELRVVPLQFAAHELPLLELTESMLTAKFAQDDDDAIYFYTKATEKEMCLNVKFYGAPYTTDAMKATTVTLRSDLTSDSSFKIDPTKLASLKLDIPNLEKQYEARIFIDAKSGVFNLFGTRDGLSALLAHLQSELGESTKASRMIKFSNEHIAFVSKFIIPEVVDIAKAAGLTLVEKRNCIFINGEGDIKKVRDVVEKACSKITTTAVTKVVDINLIKELENKLKDVGMCFCNIEKTKDKKKSLLAQVIKEEGDDDNVDDDDSETISDTSSVTSSDVTSESGDSKKQKEPQLPKHLVKAEVKVVHFNTPQFVKEVQQTLDLIEPYKEVLQYKKSDIFAVKKMRIDWIRRNNSVFVFNEYKKNLFVVRGLCKTDVQKTIAFIKDYMEKHGFNSINFPLSEAHFHFLIAKRKSFLNELKAEFSLNNVEIYPEKTTFKMCLEGQPTRVAQAREEVRNMLNTLKTQEVKLTKNHVPKWSRLKKMQKELEDTYDMTMVVPDNEDQSGGVAVTLVGPAESSTVDWGAAKDTVRGFLLDWSPPNFPAVASLLLSKKQDVAKVKTEYNLRSLPYVNKDSKVVTIYSTTKEDGEAAKQALEGMVNHMEVVTETVDDLHKVVVNALFKKGGQYQKKVEELQKTQNTPGGLPGGGVVITPIHNSVKVRGAKVNVQTALLGLKSIITEIQNNISIHKTEVPSFCAPEFSKEQWKITNDLFMKTGTWLDFPDWHISKTMAELEVRLKKAGSLPFKLQAVQGDIVYEPVECIVNAANDHLSHDGGVAKSISDKAGSKLNEECKKVIEQKGKLATGSAVITSAGDLPRPIKHVIHTVGPRYIDGKHNEENLLRSAVHSALLLATQQKFKSISLPAISANIFGYPKELCAPIIVQAVLDFMTAPTNSATSTLDTVRFCDSDLSMIRMIAHSLVELGKAVGTPTFSSNISDDFSEVEVAHQWFWTENDNSLVAFDPDQNYQIETAYILQNCKGELTVKGDIQKVTNNFSYLINFNKMTEINTQYRTKERDIVRKPKLVNHSVWEINIAGVWKHLGQQESAQLEVAYSATNPLPFVNIIFNKLPLRVIFAGMQAQAGTTMYTVRRRDCFAEKVTQQSSASQSTTPPVARTKLGQHQIMRAHLIGMADDLPKGVKQLNHIIERIIASDEVEFDRDITAAQQTELDAISLKHGVEIKSSTSSKVVKVTGLERPVNQAMKAITQLLMQASAKRAEAPPPSWEPQTTNCELKNIAVGSQEWDTIDKRMKQTLPTIQIQSIARVQNLWQWEKYAFYRSRLARKTGAPAITPELWLFHGTNTNNPDLIYNGDDGFDMRYCDQGMWGRATYFAHNAEYSHTYAYSNGGNVKQMFYARVAIGRCIDIMPNQSTLKKPPPNYDSVSGTTRNSKVYMVYENGGGYPEYLISYTT